MMDQVDELRFWYAEHIKFLIFLLRKIFRRILLNLDLEVQLGIFGLIKWKHS